MDAAVPCGGLPHSEIRGLTGICPCPRLIAACHVLLRLREPRHPSCALLSFPFSESFRLFDSLTSFLFCQLCVGKNPYLGSSCEFALLRFLLRICSFFQFPICQCALFFCGEFIMIGFAFATPISYSLTRWRITDSNR